MTHRQPAAAGRLIAALALPLLAAACAVPEPSKNSGSTFVSGNMVCTRDAPTGNRIVSTTCRDRSEVEARADSDRRAAENIPTQPHDVARR